MAQSLDSRCPTTFALRDVLSLRTGVEKLRFMNHNLVLICSRRGMTTIVAHEFIQFDLVRVADLYERGPIMATLNEMFSPCALDPDQCRVATNEGNGVLLSGQVREALGISGAGSDSLLPLVRKAIGQNGRVRIPCYICGAQCCEIWT